MHILLYKLNAHTFILQKAERRQREREKAITWE